MVVDKLPFWIGSFALLISQRSMHHLLLRAVYMGISHFSFCYNHEVTKPASTILIIFVGLAWLFVLKCGSCVHCPEKNSHSLMSSPTKPSGTSF